MAKRERRCNDHSRGERNNDHSKGESKNSSENEGSTGQDSQRSDADGLTQLLAEAMDDDCSSVPLTDMLSELMEDTSGLDSDSDNLAHQLGKVMTEDIRS